jgi:hypothetical protein
MATPTTPDDSNNLALWILVAVAGAFFVILMVFAVSSQESTTPADSEITPAEGE